MTSREKRNRSSILSLFFSSFLTLCFMSIYNSLGYDRPQRLYVQYVQYIHDLAWSHALNLLIVHKERFKQVNTYITGVEIKAVHRMKQLLSFSLVF